VIVRFGRECSVNEDIVVCMISVFVFILRASVNLAPGSAPDSTFVNSNMGLPVPLPQLTETQLLTQ